MGFVRTQLDHARLSQYLERHFASPVKVNTTRQTFPGISRETWLVDAEIGGASQGLVVRIDPPEGGSCPAPLQTEWQVYRRLWGSAVPVAEPLWYDAAADFTDGRPLMVRRLVDGSAAIAGLNEPDAAGDARRRRIAFECVEKLAVVHGLDWQACGLGEVLPAPPAASLAFRHEFDLWRNYWDAGRTHPDPVLEEVFVWLERLIPHDTPRLSLVKGNNGVGEEIWRDEKIVAMSDWELASLGDGISDLFWSQGTLRLIGFDSALEHYQQCTGDRISIERLAFASLFALVKQIVCTVVFFYGHHHAGRTSRIYGLSALNYVTEFRSRLASCIGLDPQAAWDKIKVGEKNMYAAQSGARP